MKSISIITTYYEGKKYLDALCSMIKRNIDNLFKNDISVEYIIVNDSPWEKITISKEFSDMQIKILNNSTNLGIHQSRVNGINFSSGDYVLILDQDDTIEDNYLLEQITNIKEADMIVCNGYKGLENGKKTLYKDLIKFSLVKDVNIYLKAANQIVSPGQCLIKKASIPKVWFDYILINNGSDDLFLWLLFFCQKRKIILNNKKLYIHNQVGSNLSNDLKKMVSSDLEMCEIAAKNDLLPSEYIKKRRRLCEFIKSTDYTQSLSLKSFFEYPDIVSIKIFAFLI